MADGDAYSYQVKAMLLHIILSARSAYKAVERHAPEDVHPEIVSAIETLRAALAAWDAATKGKDYPLR